MRPSVVCKSNEIQESCLVQIASATTRKWTEENAHAMTDDLIPERIVHRPSALVLQAVQVALIDTRPHRAAVHL